VSLCLIHADARYLPLADNSVHCCITSPPYFGLRDYGISGQIGLESTTEAYVQALVQVFREVRRVLRPDGTLWLVIGDSYAGSGAGGGGNRKGNEHGQHDAFVAIGRPSVPHGLKPKDLLGIPWRVAFALQHDGWYLRSDVIWHKPNPMPESVTDRPTRAHEYVFLLTKSARYFFDQESVRESYAVPYADAQDYAKRWGTHGGYEPANADPKGGGFRGPGGFATAYNPAGRNMRTVWTLPTTPYHGAHFATMPPALVERCVKAGTSEHGCCVACGAPWVRALERTRLRYDRVTPKTAARIAHHFHGDGVGLHETGWQQQPPPTRRTVGWHPSCSCPTTTTRPATVLDPFAGSATTLLVARHLHRHAIGLDLSWTYLHDLARERLGYTALDAWHNGAPPRHDDYHDLPLFHHAP